MKVIKWSVEAQPKNFQGKPIIRGGFSSAKEALEYLSLFHHYNNDWPVVNLTSYEEEVEEEKNE